VTAVKIRHYKMEGSYAVEAAFIVPFILGLLFAVVYMLYYMHDRSVIYSNMQNAVINVAEGRRKYTSDTEWQKDMQDGLWIFQVKSGKISQNKLYIKSDVKAECDLSIPVIRYFINSRQEIKTEDSYLAINPGYMIRAKGILQEG